MLRRLVPHGTITNDIVKPMLMASLLSDQFLFLKRKFVYLGSKLGIVNLTLDVFVAADDPHSYVTLQCVKRIMLKYNLSSHIHVLPARVNGWGSSYDMKSKWAQRDAAILSALYGPKRYA